MWPHQSEFLSYNLDLFLIYFDSIFFSRKNLEHFNILISSFRGKLVFQSKDQPTSMKKDCLFFFFWCISVSLFRFLFLFVFSFSYFHNDHCRLVKQPYGQAPYPSSSYAQPQSAGGYGAFQVWILVFWWLIRYFLPVTLYLDFFLSALFASTRI